MRSYIGHLKYKSLALVVGLGLLYAVVAQAGPLAITSGPNATNITENSADINWTTDVPADSNVWYTADPPGWQSQSPGVASGHFYGSDNVPGSSEQWAVGYNGLIIHTDNGINWSQQASGTGNSLYDIDVLSSNRAWAVGNQGTIRFYNGTSWTAQTSGTTQQLTGVKAFSPTNVWAVGYNGTILHYDGGSWTQDLSSPTTEILSSIDGASASAIWAAGAHGTLIFYNGSGWADQAKPTTNRINDLVFTSVNNGWASADFGKILKYSSGSWQVIDGGTSGHLYSIDAIDASHVWAVGQAGQITSTSDGFSWTPAVRGIDDINTVTYANSINVWAFGLNVVLYHYGINFSMAVSQSAPANIATLAPLTPNTTYYYMVEVTAGVDTVLSPIKSFNTLFADEDPPPAPTISGTTNCTTGGVFFNNLSWNAVTDVSGIHGYSLFRNGIEIMHDTNTLSYSDSPLSSGTAYSYYVLAHDNSGNTSGPSNTINITTSTQDFSLTNNSGTQNIVAGQSAAYSLSSQGQCGYSASVNLAVSSPVTLPTGMTVNISPETYTPSATGTAIAATIGTTTATPVGQHSITLRATAGPISHEVIITVNVAAPPDFSLSAVPPSQTVVAGNSTNYTITLGAINGFSDNVNLTSTGAPAGATVNFLPSASPFLNGTTTITMSVATDVGGPDGTFTITITGTDAGTGTITKQATVELLISPAPSFSLNVLPASQSTPAGASVDYSINLKSSNGLSGNVVLSVATIGSAPTNTSYAPNLITTPANVWLPANGSPSQLFTIDPSQSASAGTFTYRVTAVLNSVTKTADFTLTIDPALDFTISVAPDPVNISQNATGQVTATVASGNGLDGNVSLTLANLPVSANASWSVNPVNPAGAPSSSVLTINANNTAPGTYTVDVIGTYGTISHAASFNLIIDDNTPPVITFIEVIPGTNDATISWSTDENATTELNYGVVGCNNCNFIYNPTMTIDHQVYLNGLIPNTTYTFVIEATDASTNKNHSTDIGRTFTTLALPDGEDPVVVITSPIETTWPAPMLTVSGTVTVTATATDNVGVTSVDLFIRDNWTSPIQIGVQTISGPGNYQWSWDTTLNTNGQRLLYAIAHDASGNQGQSEDVELFINNDTEAPVITDIDVTTTQTTAVIRWNTIDDPATSLINYGLEDENPPYGYSYTNLASGDDSVSQYVEQHQVTLTNLIPYRRYHFMITSCDTSNNCGN
ncbi:MAG: Ig-like domain-containing protein [Patescibacteria group bacterium]